jgi:hypothetical protein
MESSECYILNHYSRIFVELLRNATKNAVFIVPFEEFRDYSLDPPQYGVSASQSNGTFSAQSCFT